MPLAHMYASTGGILLGTSEVGIFQTFEFFQSQLHLSYGRMLPIDDAQWMMIPNTGNLTIARFENREVIDFWNVGWM